MTMNVCGSSLRQLQYYENEIENYLYIISKCFGFELSLHTSERMMRRKLFILYMNILYTYILHTGCFKICIGNRSGGERGPRTAHFMFYDNSEISIYFNDFVDS